MILTKKKILARISKNPPLIDGLVDIDLQLQPNGVDLTVASIAQFQSFGRVDFSNKARSLPDTCSVEFNNENWTILNKGCYLITMNEVVNLPQDLIALAKPRSSIIRMGASIETAIWDAGYRGRSQCLMVVFNPSGIVVSRNARLLQLIFIKLSHATDEYRGIYQGENLE